MKTEDILLHGAAGLVILGTGFIYWPAALIVTGIYLFSVTCLSAILKGMKDEREKKKDKLKDDPD